MKTVQVNPNFEYRKIPRHWKNLLADYLSGKKHWKYQLTKSYVIKLPGKFAAEIATTDFLTLVHGGLVIRRGYAWDGSSVVFDTKHCMRASCVHDALYQLMRQGKVDYGLRDAADELYRDLCIEDGMWKWHAGIRYLGLKWLAGSHARPVKA